jgi:shikimate kinase/3-dehydroquinate synthase
MRVFLSGPMGSGKSTVARALAERLAADCVDLDAMIAAEAGQSVRDLFEAEGEAAFRTRERDAIDRLLTAPTRGEHQVVALGGGTVLDRNARHAMLDRGLLVTMSAPVEVLATRIAHDAGRPLLAGSDAKSVLARLLEERRDAYAECHAVIRSDTPVAAVVDALVSMLGSVPVVVPLGERTYRVEVSDGARHALGRRIGEAASGKVVLVTDAHVMETPWAAELVDALESTRRVAQVVLPPGESHKGLASVEAIWDRALDFRVDRSAIVVALGGGVVSDLAGFAAASLLRGVAFGVVPTTLLSMVDASVGGKTGFDRPQGKNLVGAFWQPRFVLADVAVLATLPERERIAGLAEVIKTAWLEGEDAVQALEADAAALRAGEPTATARAIRRAVAHKARIVAADERESGARRLLNLGHTVGHGIEAAGGYTELVHGEAVALGLIAAFRVARGLGDDVAPHAGRMAELLRAVGLPTDLDAHMSGSVFPFLAQDKKRTSSDVFFIVPGAPGETRVHRIELASFARLLAF